MNAAAVGLVPRRRYVLLSDALFERLRPAEIEAVFMHELGHLRQRHLLLRMLALVAPALLLAAAARTWLPPLGCWQSTTLVAGLDSRATGAALAVSLLMVYLATMFSAYCRMLENQADLFACQALGTGGTAAFLASLARIAQTTAASVDRAAWLHPSLVQRAGFLRRIEGNPQARQRFSRRVHCAAWLWCAMLTAAALLLLARG